MKALTAIFVVYLVGIAVSVTPVRPGTGNPSPRLPRTSASQLSQLNNNTTTGFKNLTSKNQVRGNLNLRTRLV